ncbi:MAG: ATP-binding protein [Armatimonadota bacterium]
MPANDKRSNPENQADEDLRLLVDSARDFAMIFTDPERRIVRWSDGAEQILGWTEPEVKDVAQIDLIFLPEDRALGVPEREQAAALRDGRAEDIRWHVKKDGTRFWAVGVMTPLYDPETGVLRGFGKVLRDQTAQKRQEDALRASEAKYRTLLESMDEGYLLGDVLFAPDGADGELRAVDILYRESNPAATKMLGRDITGLRLTEVDPSFEPYWYKTFGQVARTGAGQRQERYAAPLGIWFDFYVLKPGGAEAVAKGDTTSVAVVFQDVTGRKAAEVALRTSEEALRRANETLEAGVEQRTTELRKAIVSLEAAHADRQRLLARVVGTQEQERRRISRELHDQTGQHLTGLALGLQALEETINTAGPTRPGITLQFLRLREVAEELARDLHRIAVELRPTALDDLGLLPALRTYVERWSVTSAIPADFDSFGAENAETQGSDVESVFSDLVNTTVYRVVQESLTNIARHGTDPATRATRVSVTFQRFDQRLQVTVEDDGPGFDIEAVRGAARLGIAGMQERAALCGGTLQIESEPGRGTTVFLRLPVEIGNKKD